MNGFPCDDKTKFTSESELTLDRLHGLLCESGFWAANGFEGEQSSSSLLMGCQGHLDARLARLH
jgi:hypothetical protein